MQSSEENLIKKIGKIVPVRFLAGWVIYLRCVLRRFAGQSNEEVQECGDFLNYGITWDDVDRVYTILSNDQVVADQMSAVFRLHKTQVQVLSTLLS